MMKSKMVPSQGTSTQRHLMEILEKAESEIPLSAQELSFLLSLTENAQRHLLFKTAVKLKRQYFGNRIFFYGFIYTSTYCRNDCNFCYYRRSNYYGQRYRKSSTEIITAAAKLAESGVHLIDLTMGEDPLISDRRAVEGDRLCAQVKEISHITGLPVMVSPGLVSEMYLHKLKASGAAWFACYQETHTPALFDQLRPGQDFSTRLEIKTAASRMEFLVEEGVLCGVGEKISDIVLSIEAMKRLDADQVRVMKFVPQPGTPMQKQKPATPCPDELVIGVLRLVFPRRLIPASLDIDGISGLKTRLEAGANVVTSIVPPGEGLSGVARPSLDIEDGRRTSGAVATVLKQWGLKRAPTAEYEKWIAARKREKQI